MFFTNLVLHFSCVSTIRNGINMMKFSIYHSEEFKNPVVAFFLGFSVSAINIVCQYTNTYQTMIQDDIMHVITKFVAFKLLIQIQDYYLRSKTNFPVKAALKDPLVINQSNKVKMNKVLFLVYKLFRVFFTSFYFYFFPLLIIYLPVKYIVMSILHINE